MKKNKKLCLVVALILLACTLVFAACDSSNNSQTTNETTNNSETKNDTSDTSKETEENTSKVTAQTQPKEEVETTETAEAPSKTEEETSVKPEETEPATPETNEEEQKYEEACALIDEEKYEEAYELLNSIKAYAPAQEKLKNFIYAPQTVIETYFVNKQGAGKVPEQDTYKYVYSANGNIEKYSYVDYDLEFSFTYNQAGNPISGYELPSSQNLVYYFYNGDQLNKISDEYGNIEQYSYNDKGLLEKVDYIGEETEVLCLYEYEYYADGQIKTMTMNDIHDGVIYVYTYSEQGLLEKIDVVESNGEQSAIVAYFTMSYGEYGLEKVSLVFTYFEATGDHVYSYDKNGRLTGLTIHQNFEGEEYDYQYSFSDHKLCYSENSSTHERISFINRTHPDTIWKLYT